MTDKQIIIDKDKFEKAESEPINQEAVNKFIEETDKFYIDGVDVSGCIHYEEYFEEDEDIKIKDFCALWYNSCHSCNNHTCYYKLLKRKEQECEELTSKCSQLEEEIKDWQKEVERIQFIGSYGIMDEVKKNTQLKQTLAEIKEICNKTLCDYIHCSLNYNHSKDFECEKTSCNRAKRRKFILEVLQKINEVEE